jgi:periplasmic divalent cation tolerance protein
MRQSSGLIQITTSFADEAAAQSMLDHLLQEKLVACGHIHSVQSSYSWQGKIENQQEWVLTLKTRTDVYARTEAVIKSLHPYDEPMILGQELTEAYGRYKDWVEQETA